MILTKTKTEFADIDQIIYDKVNSSRLNELLIVVPTNRKIRYLKRDIISNSPERTISQLNLDTLATLSVKLFDASRDFYAVFISDSAAVVLLSQAFSTVKLEYFSNYKNEVPRGTLELLRNVISEYKKHGISPENLFNQSDSLLGSEKLKAKDISRIYAEYQKNTKELNAFELGDIYNHVISLEDEQFLIAVRSVFPDVNTIIVNGFDEFSQPEIDLIYKLANISDISLYLSFDYYKYNPEIFSHLEDCYKNISVHGFHEIEDRSPAVYDDLRKILRENLFSMKSLTPKASNISLFKLSASNPVKEIEIIAKEIKHLTIAGKVHADEICVAFNLISEHSNVIRDVFDSYGIPYNLTDRYNLSNAAPVIALINFLEVLENDFYYKNIFRALSGRWIEIPGVDLSNLLSVSANLKLVAGYKQWINSIDSVMEQMSNEYDEDVRYLQRRQYEKAKADIQNIDKLLKPFMKNNTPISFKKNLLSLISEIKLSSKLVNDNPGLIEKNVKAVTTLIETIDELFSLLEDEYGKSKTFSLPFFLKKIKTALLFGRYNVKERHGKGVLVTSVNEIRGLRFKYLFLGGMVDGEFPTRHQPAIFFSGEHRRKRDEYRHLLEDRYRFYQALCVPEKSLYFSFAVKEEKKELTESSFIADFEKIFTVIRKDESEYNNLIYSKDELLKAFAYQPELVSDNIFDKERFEKSISVDSIRRDEPFSQSLYTGHLNDRLSEEAESKLKSFSEKEYSATQLEDYAKCPFRFFVSRILSLESIEEPEEELEVFEIGSLIHSILYKFYSEIKEKGIILSGCNDKDFKSAEKLLFRIAEEKITKIKFTSPTSFYEQEKIFGINGKKENSILYQFLLTERNLLDGYKPEFFEYGFGIIKSSNYSHSVDVNGIKLRGKVDRIDINKDLQSYKVVDYKLGGAKPSKDDILSGISLQLPLYMYASKIFIETELNSEYKPAAAEIYSLKLTQKDFGRKTISIESKRNLSDDQMILMNEQIIQIALESVTKYVKKIVEGDFRLSQLENRENKICRYCEFKSICRIREAD
jgi:ATP-dependent helicase/nuclease subunit B